MRLVNRTRHSSAEVRRLLAFAFDGVQPELVRLRIRAPGSTAQGATSPSGRVVYIGLAAERYPHRARYSASGQAGVLYRSWQEELVDIAGHEGYHVARAGAGAEGPAEGRGHRRLTAWRRRGRGAP